ncbi:MAG: HD domain-containing protein [Desulfobacterales bacterium]|nr:HD domain-containing protein [Desulfobacterales bacterium]
MKRYDNHDLNEIRDALNRQETETLSPGAELSARGVRRTHEGRLATDYRQPFSLDVDRILHARAYTRYIDKTQVFYLIRNDHITHRVLHVQLVSKIARTIGRFLGLNQDLIEAISLGHDIGHPPFGHDGERFFSRLCRRCGIGFFLHNVQSVQFLDQVERDGKGWNLCLQTLDGILCHDGEVHDRALKPQRDKSFETLDKELASKKKEPDMPLHPMTMEGCVVRIADTISYVGRDIEDAIRLNLMKRSDLPKKAVDRLGETNGVIVFNLVTDVISNSFQTDRIAFSPETSDALKTLKRFNLDHIYMNPEVKRNTDVINRLFEILFNRYLKDLEKENRSSVIFTRFLKDMSENYMERHTREEIVRDFIAGMTDRYFLRQCPEKLRPMAREI